MNLYNTKKNYKYRIDNIQGGRSFINKMESMGIRKNTTIKRINANIGGGPVVIKVGNSKYALGRGMATKIKVEKLDNE